MFALYDTNHNKICALVDYKDYHLEQAINIDDLLYFSYPIGGLNYNLINFECYVRNGSNEYVIKEINVQGVTWGVEWVQIVCKINLEDLKGHVVPSFQTTAQTALATANLALIGTGWTVAYNDVTTLRSVVMAGCSAYNIISEIAKAFLCEITYNAVTKTVVIHQKQGADRGAYFTEQLNLTNIQSQGHTNDYITRLIPIGQNNLGISAVNGGLPYVSNYQYSTKIITAYWIDNRYTDATALRDDAAARLSFLSKPTRAYVANIIDLANVSTDWSILDYSLGDFITLLSESKNIRENQRIIKLNRYPEEPERSTIEIANRVSSLVDILLTVTNAAASVSNMTNTAGSVMAPSITGELTYAHITTANVDNLDTTIATIGTLIATKALITDIVAINANITNLTANKADVSALTASTARITTLEANSATVTQLAATNASITNIQIGTAHIIDGSITSAKIGNLAVLTANIADLQVSTGKIALLAVGSAQISDLAVSTAKIGDAQITTAKIGLLAVTNATIADATIGNAKIDRISGNKLVVVNADIGALAVKTAQIDALAVTTAKIALLAVTAAVIADATITTAKIGLLQVTTATIADATIATAKIGLLQVTAATIADATITTAKIGLLQVTAAVMADATITTAKIGLLQVTAAVIADATISTVKIGDAQITNAKIDRVSANKLVVTSADIADLNVGTAEIALLAVRTAQIDALAVTTAKIALLAVTSALIANGAIGTVQIADASITDLKVVAVSAAKMTTGTLATNLVTIQGTGGKLRMINNRLQVFDAQATPIERVTLGDVNGDGSAYGFRVRSADGLTMLLDENGVHPEGITDGSILNSKISPIANIDGVKLLDASIMGDKLVIDSITAREIAGKSISANEILALTITAAELATDSIIASKIKAGEVTADKLNVKGLLVQNTGTDGVTRDTFAIANDGSFSMAGNAKSFNYSAGVAGWQITSDGGAEFNNATIRSKVVLPNAGITNSPTGANPIRFWAGTDESNNAIAPFKVYQDGSFVSTKATLGGLFTGEVKIGNIHIVDDNINPALIEVKTNADALLKVSISENAALFNTPVSVGTALVVDPVGNTIKTPARVEINEDINTNIIFPNAVSNGNQIEINNNGFNIKESGSALVFNSKRSGATDFTFAKEGIADDVQVKIDGEILITDKLTMGNSYIQKRADGWDLMFS